MTQMRTKERGRLFAYEASSDGGITIEYGARPWQTQLAASDLNRLLVAFAGRTVALGTSRDNPPTGSLGAWLKQNVTGTAIASYLGPILVKERYAEWRGTRQLAFRP